jgi:colicin import membrane protein
VTEQNEDISKSIMLSLAVHICAVLLYSLKLTFFPDELFIYEPAIRVDLVALPDKLSAEQAPPIESPKEEVKTPLKDEKPLPEPVTHEKEIKSAPVLPKEPVVVLEKLNEKKKNTVESAIDKLRKDIAIEKVKGMLKEQKPEDAKAPLVYKGNILSPGTELTGVNKMDHQDYHAALDRHVKQFWSLPEWVAKTAHKTQVRIYLNENGLLVDAKIVRSSGQASYDESVMDSVKKASPYPAPPTKFRDIVEMEGILLGFPE